VSFHRYRITHVRFGSLADKLLRRFGLYLAKVLPRLPTSLAARADFAE
jgi:hypothetical protein